MPEAISPSIINSVSLLLDRLLSYERVNKHFPSCRCRHVQLNNDGAIEFYKKFGFKIVETKEHYYKRIEPADAYVLEKVLKPLSSDGADGDIRIKVT